MLTSEWLGFTRPIRLPKLQGVPSISTTGTYHRTDQTQDHRNVVLVGLPWKAEWILLNILSVGTLRLKEEQQEEHSPLPNTK